MITKNRTGILDDEQVFFVSKNSIVRKIWGESDIILFIFAGAAAEFALNKAVDWLYFTGKLPKDPLGRLFSTVTYARRIVFSTTDKANEAIDMITNIHKSVEQQRGSNIPDWAYRDVLFLLIHYSIASYELLRRQLSIAEKEEVYNVFYRVGERMNLEDLPSNYEEWLPIRDAHMKQNIQHSRYTADLFKQYRKHLGLVRFIILTESQKMLIPEKVRALLGFSRIHYIKPLLYLYKMSRVINLSKAMRNILLPKQYKQQINSLDNPQQLNR